MQPLGIGIINYNHYLTTIKCCYGVLIVNHDLEKLAMDYQLIGGSWTIQRMGCTSREFSSKWKFEQTQLLCLIPASQGFNKKIWSDQTWEIVEKSWKYEPTNWWRVGGWRTFWQFD